MLYDCWQFGMTVESRSKMILIVVATQYSMSSKTITCFMCYGPECFVEFVSKSVCCSSYKYQTVQHHAIMMTMSLVEEGLWFNGTI